MPTYQYECENCEHTFDHFQSMTDKKLKKCPECGKNELYRLIGGGSGIIFRGTGFYETKYKNKSAPPDKKKDSSKKDVPSCPAAESGSCPGCK